MGFLNSLANIKANRLETCLGSMGTDFARWGARFTGAITTTSPQAFASAPPVARNFIKFGQHAIAAAPVCPVAPCGANEQAVLGSSPSRVALAKPPASVHSRPVVARTPPPPPPLPLERRLEAINNQIRTSQRRRASHRPKRMTCPRAWRSVVSRRPRIWGGFARPFGNPKAPRMVLRHAHRMSE